MLTVCVVVELTLSDFVATFKFVEADGLDAFLGTVCAFSMNCKTVPGVSWKDVVVSATLSSFEAMRHISIQPHLHATTRDLPND